MFKVIANAWKVTDIRNKLLFIFFILAIYRLGTHIPLPGLNIVAWREYITGQGTDTITTLYSIIVGGGLGTIFAMGIGPYITSSIIMQLLTVAIPKLEQLKKEGEEGRKKIGQYTRWLAVILATVQGGGTVYSLRYLFVYQNWLTYIMATVAIVTGSIFIMWLGELITEKGIGNGASFLIFSNILSGLPGAITGLALVTVGSDIMQYVSVVLMILLFLAVIIFVVFIQDGERRIPVQYSKKLVGRQAFGGQSSYIPIKVNIAGVMSIIFSISLLQFPSVINQFLQTDFLTRMVAVLSTSHWFGALLYVLLIFCFTFFYTSFAVNPIEMAENMKKNGGFVPGLRPGKPTSDYIGRTINRISWIGAASYAFIAIVPVIFEWIFRINIGWGGTTLLIVTGVALEIIKQLESQLLMRHYKGFL